MLPTDGGGGEQEGFLCPVCMASCASPEALHHHFEAYHTEAGGQQQGEQQEENYRSAEQTNSSHPNRAGHATILPRQREKNFQATKLFVISILLYLLWLLYLVTET